ncbi:hypothetical protein CUZ56_02685 [Saezia sanguinis]|uniref:N-acetyltransferase domain-containing protein n=1 Tax=Saezia sanguinis TaxID=1965230 RepID=A0A433SAT1_9BURK|nr:GNAT family protein [Saezia sanguinis]RUS65840.1 hypothetical protein CUZ56_02685 [Saezia sanguinis]
MQTVHPQQRPAGAPVYIETNGYLLRSLTAADATPRFLQWINSPELLNGLNLPPLNFTQQSLAQFISSFNNLNNYLIGIFDIKQKLLIGFYTMDVSLVHKVANITTGIGEHAYEGKKVMWATLDALLDYFFAFRDVYKVVARVLATNRRMLFNFIGNPRMVLEARLYKECIGLNGKRVDVLVFSGFEDRQEMLKAGKSLE